MACFANKIFGAQSTAIALDFLEKFLQQLNPSQKNREQNSTF